MKIIFNVTVVFLICFAMVGCKKYGDDYKSYLDNKELIYPGLAQNISAQSGNLRAVLHWNPSPDPSITKYVISWNNGANSTTVEATSHDPKETLSVSIPNLNEYVYSFKIVAFDSEGRASIGQELNNVRVYGSVYRSTLLNRGYNASNPYTLKLDGSVDLNFIKADTGNVSTKLKYINNLGETKEVIVAPEVNTVNLPNIKYGTTVTYRSSYIPAPEAADTFDVLDEASFPVIDLIGDVTAFFIKNAGKPIYRKDGDTDKWGLLRDWTYNAAVVNQKNGIAGGFSTDDGGVIHVEPKDYSGAPVNNGKIYQSFTLPAGKYSVEIETGYNGGSFQAHEVVAAGTTLPDIDNLGGVLAKFSGDQNSMGGTHTINFTLAESTTVAIGWVLHLDSYTYLQFRSIRLKRTN